MVVLQAPGKREREVGPMPSPVPVLAACTIPLRQQKSSNQRRAKPPGLTSPERVIGKAPMDSTHLTSHSVHACIYPPGPCTCATHKQASKRWGACDLVRRKPFFGVYHLAFRAQAPSAGNGRGHWGRVSTRAECVGKDEKHKLF